MQRMENSLYLDDDLRTKRNEQGSYSKGNTAVLSSDKMAFLNSVHCTNFRNVFV